MTVDVDAAHAFLAGHGRLLDRHRLALVLGRGDPTAALFAVNAYRNPDGGYGWGLEPDLRSTSSQPGGALHAFEAFADLAAATAPEAAGLCDWLDTVSLPDGGLPFALPIADTAGCAPFWVDARPGVASLQITAAVAAEAHRLARHDPAVAAHPWLDRATAYCLRASTELAAVAEPFALELASAVRLLDTAAHRYPAAAELLPVLGRHIPPSGLLPVVGGKEGETVRPLDYTPDPDGPARGLVSADVIAAELVRLAEQQRPDGGWEVDFASYSPSAALEWRGHATVRALSVLVGNGMPGSIKGANR
jgi:hypothetical protein